MRWSCFFISRVVISWMLLMMSVMYTMTGISQHSWSSNNLYIRLIEVILVIVIIAYAIYILGFFEAGQVGISRLATLSPVDFNNEIQLMEVATLDDDQNKYSKLTYSFISEPQGFERYLV
mmetsp:Transcript_22903/g.38762  ORF Transcript_22903/g.38762 Transcript_22903/m.38762 type:complete len:120 (+) Transcript_22903:610-969(+)